jgi:hypothetical protein
MKKLISFILVVLSLQASAKVTLTDIQSAISCNAGISSNYWIKELTRTYGKHDYIEGGAIWFKVSGEMYGSQLSHVFVSISKYHNFVGVVLKDPPTKVVSAIRVSRLFPTNVYSTNGHWIGADSRVIMYHNYKYTKVFCSGMGNLPNRSEW